ncbi:MAG: potassium transporter Kup [Parvularculaceae bacterium]
MKENAQSGQETGGGAPASNGASPEADNGGNGQVKKAGFAGLVVGSIGVVYGDIGTSPLYAFRAALKPAAADGDLTRLEVFGVASLILWALILIVSVKYVFILLRADNNGEGGTLSLMALARRALGGGGVIFALGIVATSLFYGDAIITPAISVLSAVEGLSLVTAAFDHYILLITSIILVGLFAAQSFGTGRVAAAFGPITCVWFAALAVSGAAHIAHEPGVLAAINPWYAIQFFAAHGSAGLVTLGAVFLAVTGAEALYADLGHFGRKPIQTAWFAVVFPALALNYLGQAALVLDDPAAAANPFFMMTPGPLLLPMVVLATLATIIASQAVITGAYSVSRQAIQLGLLPRLEIRHTSALHRGQIYMPQINLCLFIGCILLAVTFRNSDGLAAAYGIAVTGTMIVTAIMAFVVVWKIWKWRAWAAAALIGPFVAIEFVFLSANMLKIDDGGWFPLLLASGLVALMSTWIRGSKILAAKTRRAEVPLMDAVNALEASKSVLSAPGSAVFLTTSPDCAPTALMHNVKHNKVLHEHNVILNIRTIDVPRAPAEERVSIERLTPRFARVILTYGFMESPNIPKALDLCRKKGWTVEIMKASFFLSRRWLRPDPESGMPGWQDFVFIALARNASNATDFFAIPTDRVIEIGTQVTV